MAISSGALTSGVSLWASRRKLRADALKAEAEARKTEAEAHLVDADSYAKLAAVVKETDRRVVDLMERLTQAERELIALRDENAELRREITRLQTIILRAGIDPQTGERLGCAPDETPTRLRL